MLDRLEFTYSEQYDQILFVDSLSIVNAIEYKVTNDLYTYWNISQRKFVGFKMINVKKLYQQMLLDKPYFVSIEFYNFVKMMEVFFKTLPIMTALMNMVDGLVINDNAKSLSYDKLSTIGGADRILNGLFILSRFMPSNMISSEETTKRLQDEFKGIISQKKE